MRTPRILVVDENAEIAQLESAMFRMHHYNVEVTVHAEEALRRLATRRYDVLVLGLPIRVEGELLLNLIRERFDATPARMIVVTWQWRDIELMRRCKDAAVFAVVARPFDVDELAALVRACIDNDDAPSITRWVGIPESIVPHPRG